MASQINRGKQQVPHFLQFSLVDNSLPRFVHHLVDLFVDFIDHRTSGRPIEANAATFRIFAHALKPVNYEEGSSSAECRFLRALFGFDFAPNRQALHYCFRQNYQQKHADGDALIYR